MGMLNEFNNKTLLMIGLLALIIILVSAGSVYYLVGGKTMLSFLVLSLSDSVNPCTFVIYCFLLIGLSLSGFQRREVLLNGLVFVSGVYLMYYLLGVGLVTLTKTLNPVWAGGLAVIFGLYTIITGAEERSRVVGKDKIKKIIRSKRLTVVFSFLIGVLISVTLLPCSASSYLVYAILISKFSKSVVFLLLALYNFVFVTPLLVILFVTNSVVESKRVTQYLVRKSRELSIMAGVLLVLLGVLIITGVLT